MKNILIAVILMTSFACKAQSPIVPLDTYIHNTPEEGYIKDLDNELDKFVGTWKFTSGLTSLTIELQKLELFYNGKYYQDLLIGEYKYIENGIEIVNYLPLLDEDSGIIAQGHTINGRQIIPKDRYVSCDDCSDNERRLRLSFHDSERLYLSTSVVLRYLLDETNPEKMTATIYIGHGGMKPTEDSPEVLRVPFGEYTMVKQ
ncbi:MULTISPECIES: DUF6705 family protein [Winogradskyella]|uniref:DUF6705 family protein n=1 Tax=Winogradskyella TaxID=286104 RepID=UPI0015CCC27C|nr:MULTISPECIES: DUF6705 family protein [Winogradskyella]QNK77763.1 hypothetical protein H7F37_01340 [Winogradskyella sp. PAMC22761]QXP78794.1 hypothetical protein H0I32_16555 [Winogradskyella sp. HaHa_3_26]